MSDLYCVTYFLYNDTDTLCTEVFSNKQDASNFEDLVWQQCQRAHIEVNVTSFKTTVKSFEDAAKRLEEVTTSGE